MKEKEKNLRKIRVISISNKEKGIEENLRWLYPLASYQATERLAEMLKKPEEILDKIKNIEEEETLLKFREFELDIIEEYLEEHEKYEHLSVDKVLIIKRIYEDDDIDID